MKWKIKWVILLQLFWIPAAFRDEGRCRPFSWDIFKLTPFITEFSHRHHSTSQSFINHHHLSPSEILVFPLIIFTLWLETCRKKNATNIYTKYSCIPGAALDSLSWNISLEIALFCGKVLQQRRYISRRVAASWTVDIHQISGQGKSSQIKKMSPNYSFILTPAPGLQSIKKVKKKLWVNNLSMTSWQTNFNIWTYFRIWPCTI